MHWRLCAQLITTGMAAATASLGLLFAILSPTNDEFGWVKVLLGVMLAVVSVAAGTALWGGSIRFRTTMRMASLVLIPAGLLWLVASVRLAVRTGDWEYYAVGGAVLLAAQGVAASALLHESH